MNTLVMGLYVEGPTDDRFLPVIIQRTAEHILLTYQQFVSDLTGTFKAINIIY